MNDPVVPLSERDRDILAFERQWWKYPGAKEQAIRDELDISPTRYWQRLLTIIDTPAALAYAPQTVHRLQRLRDARRRARAR